MEKVKLIQKFEKVFIEAAELACKMKKKTKVSQKFQSGISDIDTVTDSDLAVQKYIIERISQSELVNCELVAEEDTPIKSKFSKSSDYVITIDPIDGTRHYSEGGQMYTTIVTLHNKKRPLYTFDYFPEFNWGVKMVNDGLSFIGRRSEIDSPQYPKTIIYSAYGETDPQKTIPDLYEKFTKRGYVFSSKNEINKGIGATALFLFGVVGGHFVENGSAVDCLVSWHYAITKGYHIYKDIDISKTSPSTIGGSEQYSGYYLAIRR